MFAPGDIPGVCFGEADDGDPRFDADARSRFSENLGIPDAWATVEQVHGTTVAHAVSPLHMGEADGLITETPMLPLAIATADCVPVAVAGSASVAVVHAGWRGVAAGVVEEALRMMKHLGDSPRRAAIGPHIGPCCYEVGAEVVEAIGGFDAVAESGALSVDLGAAIRSRLPGIPVNGEAPCTLHDSRFHSYRGTATPERQVTVAWLPKG